MSVDFLEMLEKEVERAKADIPDDSILTNIAALADRQLRLESMQEKLQELSKQVTEAHREVSERYLPNALASAGVTEFKLVDGSVISVKKGYFPSIEAEHQAEAFAWMVDHGHDIIKNEVIVKLPKGKSEEAKEVVTAIRDLGFTPEQKEGIHWQTFRAWAKEVMEKGAEIPDIIKIHTIDKATVKRLK